MLKENAMYQKDESATENDVNLLSKDMEVNFSAKQDEEDDSDSKI